MNTADLELMRERYLDAALDEINDRGHSGLAARILAAAEGGAQPPAPVIVLPPSRRGPRQWLSAAALILALGLIGWLIVQRVTPPPQGANAPIAPPPTPKDETPAPEADEIIEPRSLDDYVRAYLKVSDADKDGGVSWEESRAVTLRMEEASESARTREGARKSQILVDYAVEAEWFLRSDTNDDWVLSRDELSLAIERTLRKPGEQPLPDLPLTPADARKLAEFWVAAAWPHLLKDHDKDKDGKFTEQELLDALHPDEWTIANGDDPARNNPFKRADANGDGGLDQGEFLRLLDAEAARDPQALLGVEPLQESMRWFIRERADALHAPQRALTLKPGDTIFAQELDPRGGRKYSRITLKRVSPFWVEAERLETDKDGKAAGKPVNYTIGGYSEMLLKDLRGQGLKLKSGEVDCLYDDEKFEGFTRRTWHLKDYPCLDMRREEDGKLVYEVLELRVK